jgi:hypothetical protein
MLEADLLTPLCYVLALAALAAGGEERLRNCLAAGLVLGAATFTAQPARFFTLAMLVIVAFAFRRTLRGARLVALSAPVVLAAVAMFTAGSEATARLGGVSVFTNGGLWGGAWQAMVDYFEYQGPVLLFIRGDTNLRHSSGFEGLLFVTAAIPLALGADAAFRRRSEPLATIALLGTLIAPAAASLAIGVSARRDVVVLPFLLVLLAYGWQALFPWLQAQRRRLAAAAVCVLVAAIPYYVDYATAYPTRAARSFDTGGVAAITEAHAVAQGHGILVSHRLGPEDALVALRPDPRVADPLGSVGVRVARSSSDFDAAPPGDLLVLTYRDTPPPGSVLLFQEVAISVYRR